MSCTSSLQSSFHVELSGAMGHASFSAKHCQANACSRWFSVHEDTMNATKFESLRRLACQSAQLVPHFACAAVPMLRASGNGLVRLRA